MTLKRCFDVAVSAAGLVVLSPVLAAVAVTTAVAFRGAPFHVAERLGKDGKPFGMIKFRSMTHERDADGKLLPDEKRGTGYGRFLRVTSADELPQLINILKGDMSLVGPRPRSPALGEGESIPKGYEDVLSVRPGLTGVWQVAVIGRPPVTAEERAALDAQYVRGEQSLARDLKLMVGSLPSIVRGHNGETPGPFRNG